MALLPPPVAICMASLSKLKAEASVTDQSSAPGLTPAALKPLSLKIQLATLSSVSILTSGKLRGIIKPPLPQGKPYKARVLVDESKKDPSLSSLMVEGDSRLEDTVPMAWGGDQQKRVRTGVMGKQDVTDTEPTLGPHAECSVAPVRGCSAINAYRLYTSILLQIVAV